ncbi:MAG: endospore germination permease [Paenibacillus sp.]|uniref:GerAB/ArcD/ProY family transporter n=1 Tax=Paenibacillus sp. TaxID=58172 RepID=UPI00290BE876|nr:endospore germination permease [Paenibacillus sp.]MDU4695092.1 endospore germination permease [Paenibacillus sp.]
MKITKRQIILLGILYIGSISYLQTFSLATQAAHQHAMLSYVIGGLISMVALWMVSMTLRRFSDRNLLQALAGRFPIFGRSLLVFYLLFLLFISARDIRVIADFTNTVLLNRTPIPILGLMVTATAVYICQGGIRAFLGLSEIYIPIFLGATFFIVLVLARDLHLNYLIPYFSPDWSGIMKGTWFVFPYQAEILALPLVISGKYYKAAAGYISLAIGSVMMIVLLLNSQMVLGIPLVGKLIHPGYEMIRQIQITDFIDRFDLLLMALWYPTALGKIAFDLYVLCYTLQIVVPKLSGRLMTAPVGALAFACSVWFFRNALQQFHFNFMLPFIALTFHLALPILFFAVLRPRRNKPEPKTG